MNTANRCPTGQRLKAQHRARVLQKKKHKMNSIKENIGHMLWPLLMAILMTQTITAQTSIKEYKIPTIVPMTSARTITASDHTIYLRVAANVDYVAECEAPWITIERNRQGITAHATANAEMAPRTAEIRIESTDGTIQRFITITQERENTLDGDIGLEGAGPLSARSNGASNVYYTIDNKRSTYYRVSAKAGTYTEDNPVELTYTFSGIDLDGITYCPATFTQGKASHMAVLYMKKGDTDYRLFDIYDMSAAEGNTSISFGDDGLKNVTAIRIHLWGGQRSGAYEYINCAEITFDRRLTKVGDYSLFADELLTKLRSGVTREQVDTLSNVFVRNLARRIQDGTYDTAYRVGTYPCRRDPALVGKDLVTGKNYDIFEGVTGVMVAPGRQAVVVEGLPGGAKASLTLCTWCVPENQDPNYTNYALKNGMNIINSTSDSCALAYVTYVSTTPEKYGPIRVHFVNGIQNGYVTSRMTNEEIETIFRKAPYRTIDLLGDRVHMVWEPKTLLKTAAGSYRQLMNIYDTVICWQHRLIGLEKYKKIPRNRTLWYVNYDYFMYQTYLGASGKYDVLDILNPQTILKTSSSTMWGIAHEWGHQHQLQPYFCWAGLTEVTNNMNSCYDCMHFGVSTANMTREFRQGYLDYFVNDPKAGNVSRFRNKGFKSASRYSYSPKMRAAFEAMADSVIPPRATDALHAANFNEGELGNRLASFFQLYIYYLNHGNTDFYPDLYESLRHTDSLEDKYSLIASVQNNHSERYQILKKKYPGSCWIADNYLKNGNASRWENQVPYIMNFVWKASTLSGYNMVPYFEQWGYLRQLALCVDDDYGTKYYCMTKEMYDEFKKDMDARVESGELKEMPQTLIDEIVTQEIPKFPLIDIPN